VSSGPFSDEAATVMPTQGPLGWMLGPEPLGEALGPGELDPRSARKLRRATIRITPTTTAMTIGALLRGGSSMVPDLRTGPGHDTARVGPSQGSGPAKWTAG
jgi:hypothetical protein